ATIAADVPGCRAAVVHGETGLLVPAQDPAALAAAMQELAADPQRVAAMGAAARRRAALHFESGEVCRRFLAFVGLEDEQAPPASP
ncbi:MAG: glycosyltransferase, partial [Phycisphaerales bacterium]